MKSFHFITTFLLFFCIFTFLLFLTHFVCSFSITCEAGGPYATGSTVLIVGNVSGEASNITNITIDIKKQGVLKTSQNTSSDSSGTFFSIFTQPFDVGAYDVNVTASNSTHNSTCNDTFDVVSGEISVVCQQKTVSIEGSVIYKNNNLVNSGKIFISVDGLKISNTTNFSNGYFNVYLTTCLNQGKKYVLRLLVVDDEGKKGLAFIPFVST